MLGNEFLFGGDYNPDQWKDYPEILKEDMRLMKLAGCNLMSVGIFSWATLEPEEGVYDFSFLDSVMDRLAENGIGAALATPSAARPAWMSMKYPEVLRVNERFERIRHGQRHNHCYTSPVYRQKTAEINRRLAERYKDHPALKLWHVSNEYNGICYCDKCQEAFREWLKERYDGDLDKLNHAWWSTFWSHNYTDWSQIEPPSPMGENSVHGLVLDWKRFATHQTIDFYLEEVKVLKEITPDVPATANWYWLAQRELNYKEFSKYVDIIAWDEYPLWHSPAGDLAIANEAAFIYNHCRCFKEGQPFLLMESTPSNVSYRTANGLKRPGMAVTTGLQAIAHGADSVQYFQWRKSRGGMEKYHGAVVDHEGSENTRTFREVAELGGHLKELKEIKAARTHSDIAIVYDAESEWALSDCFGFKTHDLQYDETCFAHHLPFYRRGFNIDVISPEDDFSKYRLLILPMLHIMREETAERIAAFTEQGGTVVMTYISAYVNETDLCHLGGFPAGRLKEVFGIRNEEIDSMYDGVSLPIKMADGTVFGAKDYAEVLHLQGAEALAVYDRDYYAGTPCLTKNRYGKGCAYYIGFRDEGDFLDAFYGGLTEELGIAPAAEGLPEGVTAASRVKEGEEYIFLMNFTAEEKKVSTNHPVLLGKRKEDAVLLPPYGTAVLKRRDNK